MAPINSYNIHFCRTVAAYPPSGLKCASPAFGNHFRRDYCLYRGKVLPIGAVGIIGITVFALAYAAGDKTASGAITTALE